jgi:hypothetical protein
VRVDVYCTPYMSAEGGFVVVREWQRWSVHGAQVVTEMEARVSTVHNASDVQHVAPGPVNAACKAGPLCLLTCPSNKTG